MNKSCFAFMTGLCAGVTLVMLYLHRSVIKSLILGKELPKAPECCPAFQADQDEA